MISIIITAYKEPRTIQKAIISIAEQNIKDNEIILVAPDKETLNEAHKLKSKYDNLKIFQDQGLGKSSAMNLAVSKAKGKILIFTDGDVYVGKKSLERMVEKIKNPKIGAVSGKPISLNKKNNKFGFWAHTLTSVADLRRKRAIKTGKRMFCSGYLFAIRKALFPKLPEELLSEDGYISHKVYQQGFKIDYSQESEVYINYPNNFSDWINQKRRSAGGYNQNYKILNAKIRSFSSESKGGADFLKYISNFKELSWLLQLFIARVYLWVLIYRDINFRKKSREELWIRVESTK
ncbi:MAG: glycosyltransferase family 2 protein [Candidatus Pacearchaeota archaeon]|nr:glycosyltransferase family 2 protein [Candidatus Pacearchaeota archaeon]